MNKPLAYLVTSINGDTNVYTAEQSWLHEDAKGDIVMRLYAIPVPLTEDQMQTKFEAWWNPDASGNKATEKVAGNYKYSGTQNAWSVWMAAFKSAMSD